jgi:hypothetical protein
LNACSATTLAGNPCRAPAAIDGFCAVHSPNPAMRQAVALGRAQGGATTARSRRTILEPGEELALDSVEDVLAFLQRVMTATASGLMDARSCNALVQAAAVCQKSLDQVQLSRELAEARAEIRRLQTEHQEGDADGES